MKLTKNASGKTILKITKAEWKRVGRQQGWMKKAAQFTIPATLVISKEEVVLKDKAGMSWTFEIEESEADGIKREILGNADNYRSWASPEGFSFDAQVEVSGESVEASVPEMSWDIELEERGAEGLRNELMNNADSYRNMGWGNDDDPDSPI